MTGLNTESIIKPSLLSNGATIGVISPASRPVYEEKYYQGINYLKHLGYSVVESPHVLDERGYLAGEDLHRAEDINSMFRNPEIDAIICSRGGYGTPRIIDLIDFDAIREQPKIFVGYSDITALHLAIWEKTRLVTFSGPMVAVEMGNNIEEFTEKNFWKLLVSAEAPGLICNPAGDPVQIYREGRANGKLLGGCLSLINVLLGTPYCPDFKDAILFIEDIEEEPYRVDRYLAQLKMAGIFDRISGIVVGQFIDCVPANPNKPSLSIEQILDDYFKDLNIPIIMNFAYGHGMIKNTIPVGCQVELNTDQGGLIFNEGVVSSI